MTLYECVMECAKHRELVAQFDRLSGTTLSKGVANGDQLGAFVMFVYECVWTRIEWTKAKVQP